MKSVSCVVALLFSVLCLNLFAGESSEIGLNNDEKYKFGSLQWERLADVSLHKKFDLHDYEARMEITDRIRKHLRAYNNPFFREYDVNGLHRRAGGKVYAVDVSCRSYCYKGLRKSGKIPLLRFLFGENKEECALVKVRLVNFQEGKTQLLVIAKAGDRSDDGYRLTSYYSRRLQTKCRYLAKKLARELHADDLTSASSQ